VTTPATPTPQPKRSRALWTAATLFFFAGLALFIYWFVWWQFEVTTTDAYVSGNNITVTPQVPGIVTTIYTDDTFYVEENAPVIQLDLTDFHIALGKAEEELALAVRNVVQMFEKVDELEANLQIRLAEEVKAMQDFQHRTDLVDAGGVSVEDFEHAAAHFTAATAAVDLAHHQLDAAIAEVENTTPQTHPMVERAKEVLRRHFVDLQRATIYAPASGVVAERRAQVGEWVNPAEPLLSVIPFDQMWIDANFKEVQLKDVRIGQPVEIRTDFYKGDVLYRGTVVGIGAGTGSVFSILPPQNATGNWIKIVQRVPVRIALDPKQLKEFPLRLGLSCTVTIDTHNLQGPAVPKMVKTAPTYSTTTFEDQEEGAEELINHIIETNLPAETDGGADGA
jgi:membrane fusion protein (multidrug efflux system)